MKHKSVPLVLCTQMIEFKSSIAEIPLAAVNGDGSVVFDGELFGSGDRRPRRCTVHTQLHGIGVGWLPSLHDGLADRNITMYWRSRGRYIPSTNLERYLTDGVADSFVVACGQRSIGLVELLGYSPEDRRAEIAAVSWAHGALQGWVVEAVVAALDEWFVAFDLRTVSAFVATNSPSSIAKTLRKFFVHDGRLRDHLWIDGKFSDVDVFSMTRAELEHHLTNDERVRALSPHWRLLSTM
jgi:hypothetical protein